MNHPPILDGKLKEEDEEINAMAKKIREGIDNSMRNTDKSNVQTKVILVPRTLPKEVNSIDGPSITGKFGWHEIAKNIIIPYLMRCDHKFVSERIAEDMLFKSYRIEFTNEVFNCFNLTTVPATKAEAALLNEINHKHSDNKFGLGIFYQGSPLILLDDIIEMFQFLSFCRDKLIRKDKLRPARCGFLLIEGQNCVPFVVINNIRYAPLFYFEGESQYLEDRSIMIQGWDLAYIKISCKIQGIRKELFDANTLQAVDLELVKRFFPSGTEFKICWLADTKITELLSDIAKQSQNKVLNNQNLPIRRNLQRVTPTNVAKCYIALRPLPSPYKIQRVLLEKKYLNYCINMQPGDNQNLLVTLEEVALEYFNVPLEVAFNAIIQMKIPLHMPNKQQLAVLEKCGFRNPQGMILVKILEQNLRQLYFILKSMSQRSSTTKTYCGSQK